MLFVARYVIPVSDPHIENGAVLVRGGRIADVGSAALLKTRYPNEPIRDFGLAALLPGFVDAHTHLEYSAMRGLINDAPYAAWKLHIANKEQMFSLGDWNDSALLGALEVVRSGITTVADITGTGASLKAVRAVGLRAIIYREVGTMERREVDATLDRAFADVQEWRALAGQTNASAVAASEKEVALSEGATTASAPSNPAAAKQDASSFANSTTAKQGATAMPPRQGDPFAHAQQDVIGQPPSIQIGLSPSALYSCHPLIFEGVARYAADGTPVALHLAGSREEYEFIRYGSSPFSVHSLQQERGYGVDVPPWLATGVSPVRYILNWGVFDAPNVLAIHCVQVDDADIEKLAEYAINIAVCPRCNAQLAMGIAPTSKFFRAGLKVGLGTDSPAATDSTDPFMEMRTGLLLQRATGTRQDFIKANQMLRMATLGSAEALGLSDEIGSLQPGKAADLIAVDLSNSNQAPTHDPGEAVLYTASPNNIMMTMVAGTILYDGHHQHSVDIERVFVRAEEMRIKLSNIT
ncbi:MAG: amidohydrolase family protein [Coriobacteriales bacterium]|jgi:5-methylthioadenosine/S-adenosylhomocysteine deaminase|nr:amidohydrolase family protein [Coriobacteriales bacterium]